MKDEKKVQMFDGQSADDFGTVERMNKQIRDLGGLLHFVITRAEDGWVAKCDEVEGIITGGLNANPDDYEIESQVREAIYTAFDVKVKVAPERLRASISGLTLSIV